MGPILFNFYINDLSLFVKEATLHNYADDNTLPYLSMPLSNLIEILEEEAGVLLSWLKQDQMIANPEKFHALLIKKDQTNTRGENFSIQGKTIKCTMHASRLRVPFIEVYQTLKKFKPFLHAKCFQNKIF